MCGRCCHAVQCPANRLPERHCDRLREHPNPVPAAPDDLPPRANDLPDHDHDLPASGRRYAMPDGPNGVSSNLCHPVPDRADPVSASANPVPANSRLQTDHDSWHAHRLRVRPNPVPDGADPVPGVSHPVQSANHHLPGPRRDHPVPDPNHELSQPSNRLPQSSHYLSEVRHRLPECGNPMPGLRHGLPWCGRRDRLPGRPNRLPAEFHPVPAGADRLHPRRGPDLLHRSSDPLPGSHRWCHFLPGASHRVPNSVDRLSASQHPVPGLSDGLPQWPE